MISSTAEYALRAVVHLASGIGRAETAQQVAAATRVPPGYMAKVLQDLVKGGVVHSQRGPRGGFTLARPAEQISVLDVVNAVDPIKRIRTCPLGIPEHGTNLCALHRCLDDAIAQIEESFGRATMADLLKPRQGERSCHFPCVSESQEGASLNGSGLVQCSTPARGETGDQGPVLQNGPVRPPHSGHLSISNPRRS
jgi:Rrf2 family transcriptional regulator, nitric oxide-sensitive transcriptional repressor